MLIANLNRLVFGAVLTTAALSIVGCSTDGSATGHKAASTSYSTGLEPPTSTSTDEIRQVDDAGRPLPFRTVFPRRWSANNDGTPYEPCTAASAGPLASLNIDPSSVRDVASADHQTARGCQWEYRNERFAYISQFVGNMNRGVTTLAGYQAQYSFKHWFPDQMINGRVVGVVTGGPDECTTHVQSGRALVATTVGIGSTSNDVSENCRRALAFTRATIDLIPR